MIGLIAAVSVAAMSSVAPASAATLEELDTQLRTIEYKVQQSGVAPDETEPVDPEIIIQPPQVCTLKMEEMRSEKVSLKSLLVTKRDEVVKISKRVSKMRRKLLVEACNDSDIKGLAALKRDIRNITLKDERLRADALLDCVNNKIEANERKKVIEIERGADSYAIIGLNKHLDQLNKLSGEMMDISIEIGSAASLRDRIEFSSEKLNYLCVETDI